MFGVLRWTEERGGKVERIQLCGLPVVLVKLFCGKHWQAKRLDRAARILAQHGVRRVLVPTGFSGWERLKRRGLCPVDPVPLYRVLAHRLVLEQLKHSGINPQKAQIVLRGNYVDADLARTARQLCPVVRSLVLQVERGGEGLARELYREFGAVCETGTQGDVVVCFGAGGRSGELNLWGETPELLGMELTVPGLEVPEELERDTLLTALWQGGRLKLEQIEVKNE